MANTPRLFEDLSRVASGAMGTVVGMRDEAEAQLRQRLERVLERMWTLVAGARSSEAHTPVARAMDRQGAGPRRARRGEWPTALASLAPGGNPG